MKETRRTPWWFRELTRLAILGFVLYANASNFDQTEITAMLMYMILGGGAGAIMETDS